MQRSSNIVLGGNGRLEVLKSLGHKTVPVHYIDIDDKKAKALALALNRTAELAGWDMERVKEQLAEIDDPGLIGFDDDFGKIEEDDDFKFKEPKDESEKQLKIVITFEDDQEMEDVFAELNDRGFNVKIG